MRRVPPSMVVGEELAELLHGEHAEGTNVISSLVEVISRLVIQELLEGEQSDFLGSRGRYQRPGDEQVGWRNGYEPGRIRTAEGAIKVRLPQVRGAGEPYRSGLMSFLEGNSEVLDRLVTEMYARGLSTRDVEDAFTDAKGELLISRSAVSEITDQLWGRLRGLLWKVPLGHLRRVPVLRRHLRVAPAPGGERGPPRRLVHRLRRAKAPAAPGGREQGVGGLLDRVLPQHDREGAAAADDGDDRRCARDDQGGRVGLPALDPHPLLHRLSNIRAKLPDDEAAEVMAHLYAVRDAPTLDAARAAADRLENTYRSSYPAAIACFADDGEALLAIHRVPVRHRIRVRTTNLAERSFEEERRRTKVIPRLMSERSTMKLAFATMISVRCCARG